MKRALILGFVGILMVSAPGCGSDAESLIKQSIADMNALSDALEKNDSPDKIKAAADKLKGTMEKMKNKKVTKSEDERLQKKYEKEVMDAAMRLGMAASKNPQGAAAVQDALRGIGG